MKVGLIYLFVMAIALTAFTYSFAQTPTPEQIPKPVAAAEDEDAEYHVYSSPIHTPIAWVSVDFRIVASGWYVPDMVDAVKGRIVTKIDRENPVEPQTLYLALIATSKEKSKHADGDTFAVFVDDKLLLSRNLKLVDSWGPNMTIKSLDVGYIPYKDFVKITQAEKATFQIGETRVDLKPKELQRLRDLKTEIERLIAVVSP